jgi:ABC-type multidrug transport system fused ATPase/permease subunit
MGAGIDDLLASRSATSAKNCLFMCLALVYVLDIAVAFFLRAAPVLVLDLNATRLPRSWKPAILVEDLRNFDGDTVDLVLLCAVRLCLFTLLTWLGIRVGTLRLDDLVMNADGSCTSTCGACSGASLAGTAAREPLLINAAPSGDPSARSAAGGSRSGGPGLGVARTAAGLTLTHEVKEEHLASHMRKEKATARKNLVCALIFLAATGAQIYMGIKCIGFDPGWSERPNLQIVQIVLLIATLALTNLESWLCKRAVMVWTKEEGFFVPEFHSHRLFFNPNRPTAYCDMCRNRSRQVYNCPLCDWDCCPACFNKKDKATGEGIIRGDKGVKDLGRVTFKSYIAKGFRLLLPEMPIFTLALALLLGNSLVKLLMPNFQGSIMDAVVNAHHACVAEYYNVTFYNVTTGDCAKHKHAFLENVLTYLALAFATSVLAAFQQLSFQLVARRVILHIKGKVFDSMIVQDIAFFDGMRTGDLQQRMSADVRAMASPIFSALPVLLSQTTMLTGGVVMCFIVSWRLSMMAFATVLPVMHVTRTYAQWSGKINRAIFQDFSDGNAISNEAVSNIRTVRACSSENFERTRYRETLTKAFSKGVKDATVSSLAVFLNNSLDLGAGVLILWFGGTIAMQVNGAITVGALIKYQLYYNMMNNGIQALSNVLNSFTRAAGAAERVMSVLELKPDIDPDHGVDAGLAVSRWDLAFEGVKFYYQMRPRTMVLDGFSLTIPEGSVCALVGPSGGGKSTLIHLTLRFYDPTDGCIRLGGNDYRQLNFPSVHGRIGTVSQETQLFNDTLTKNIMYGHPDPDSISDEAVEHAARAAQAWDFIDSFEDGMQTKVGERGQRLSGGQKQRIAIARCLLRKPKLLLLDEATSALDAQSEAAVQKALDGMIWHGNHTVVLVAHRLSTVVNASKIAVVQQGIAVEEGTHTELLAKEESVYKQLVMTQLQKSPGGEGGAQ